MWPWKRQVSDSDAIRTLTQRVEDLEAAHRRLYSEWLEMYDKLTRRDERIRKRQERENEGSPALTTPQDVKAALRARYAAMRGSNGHP